MQHIASTTSLSFFAGEPNKKNFFICSSSI
jgi:hypothetical protein